MVIKIHTIKFKKLNLNEVKYLGLKILASDHFNKFFSMKQLRDEVIKSKYNIALRDLFSHSIYKPLQIRIGKQLNHALREFQKLNYIEKYSNRFWVINKEKINKDERLKHLKHNF